MFREDGEKGLNSDMAITFACSALERINKEEQEENFKNLYFQLITLMLYLLRYRKSNPACFDPNNDSTLDVFKKTMESMEVAKEYFFSKRENGRARKVRNIIEGFNKYLFYEGTEDVLTVLGDLAGDM